MTLKEAIAKFKERYENNPKIQELIAKLKEKANEPTENE